MNRIPLHAEARAIARVLALSASLSICAAALPGQHNMIPHRTLFPIREDGKVGYIDSTGRVVIEPRFDTDLPFSEGLAAVRVDRAWGYIDTTGTMLIAPQFDLASHFSGGRAAVEAGGKWGFVDRTGTWVVQPTFDHAFPFSEGLAKVTVGNKAGFLDQNGRMVIPPRFDSADWRFGGGRAWVRAGDVEESGAVGFIDRAGNLVVQPRFDWANHFSEGLAAIRTGGWGRPGKWGYVDSTGAIVIRPQFDDAKDFSEGMAVVLVGKNAGFIDTRGTMVIRPQFDGDFVGRFSGGLAAVRVRGKWGYVDRTGRMVIAPRFDNTQGREFSEWLAAVQIGDRWGYIDTTGRVVIEPQFSNAGDFSGGMAWVGPGAGSTHGGYINRAGGYIWKPRRDVAAEGLAAQRDTGVQVSVMPPPIRAFLTDKRVTSKKKLFSVAVPQATNFAGVPFAIEHAARRDSFSFDLVGFLVKDFGEVHLVSVRLIPQRVLALMAAEPDSQTLANLSWKALSDWRGGLGDDPQVRLDQEPEVVQETLYETHLGRGLLRIYLARGGSLLVNETGGGAHRFDTLIGVVVVKRSDRYVYVIAENDSRPSGQDDLSRGMKALFASIQLLE